MRKLLAIMALLPLMASRADTPSHVVQAAIEQHKTIIQQWSHPSTQPATQPASSQPTTQPAQSFRARWLSAILETFFNFLNTELQSQTTVANIEQGIEALFLPK